MRYSDREKGRARKREINREKGRKREREIEKETLERIREIE